MRDVIVDNNGDIIDSRDVIKSINTLTEERQNVVENAHQAISTILQKAVDSLDKPSEESDIKDCCKSLVDEIHSALAEIEEWDASEDGDNLNTLQSLAGDAEAQSSQWDSGEILIRESHWGDYCEELVKNIGDLPRDIPSYIAIDWDETADNLKQDYSEVDFDGVTYLIRNT